MLYRLRGMLSTAAIWGLIAVPVEMATLTLAAVAGAELPTARMLGSMLAGAVVHSALNGFVFAALVTVGAHHRLRESLRRREFVVWGAIAGLASPALGVLEAWRLGHLSFLPSRVTSGLAVAGMIGAATGAAYHLLANRRLRGVPDPAPDALLRPPPEFLASAMTTNVNEGARVT